MSPVRVVMFTCVAFMILLWHQLNLYMKLAENKEVTLPQYSSIDLSLSKLFPKLRRKRRMWGTNFNNLEKSSTQTNISIYKNPWEGVSPDLTIRNFYTGKFIKSIVKICKGKNDEITLLILVPSGIDHFEKREALRKTWGSFSSRKDVAIGFAVGSPKYSSLNKTIVHHFQQEVDLYGDIIIANMEDTYANLTLKVLFMVEWAFTYCTTARFFMKTDDDVFLNVPLVLQFISHIQESDIEMPKIYGNVFSGHLPQRNKSHQHYVSRVVYPYELSYPNFTSGPSYLLSSKLLKPLWKEAMNFPLFNLEDVLLTGFTAAKLGIERVNVTRFRNELKNPYKMAACEIVSTIAGMTDGSSIQLYYVWYNYLMGKVLCRRSRKNMTFFTLQTRNTLEF